MSNFSFLHDRFPLLGELGEKGEHYLYTDPNDHSQVQRIR